MKTNFCRILFLLVFTLVFGRVQGVMAGANARTWDGGGATPIWTDLANWNISNGLNNGDPATFATAFTSGTNIDIASPRTISTLTISTTTDFSLSNGSLTISAGTLTRSATSGTTTINSDVALGAAAAWNISGDLIAAGTVSGAFTLTKSGTGKLILAGSNSFSGLAFSSGTSGSISIRNNGGLGGVSLSVTSGDALELDGGITTGANALTLNGTGISTGGALRNTGGDNTYAGAITLGAATRINSDSGTLTLDVASGNAITGTADNLTFGGAGDIVVNDPISDTTGTLTKDGVGRLTLSGANVYSGLTTLSTGTLRATTSTSALGSGALTLNGGTLELANDTGLSFNRNTTVGGTAAIVSDRLTGGAGVTHTLGTLSIGTWTLSVAPGGNVSSGPAGLTFGAVTLSAGGAVFDVASGALLTLASVGGNTFGFTVQGAGDTTVSGVIGTTTGTVTKNGTGTLTLNGANTYTGLTTISGGTLALGSSGSLAAGASVSIGAGDTFDVSAKTSPYNWGASASLTASGTGLVVGSTAATIVGPAAGTVALGTRPITLTYDGSNPALYISQGTLSLSGNAFTVNGALLPLGAYTIIRQASGNISSSGAHTVTGTAITGLTGTISVSGGEVLLTVTAGPVSAANSTISTSPSSVTADGSATTTLTVTAKDAANNVISGASVVLSATGTANTFGQPGVTGVNGQTTGTLASTKAEAKTVSATINGTPIIQTAAVTFTAGAASQVAFGTQPSNAQHGVAISPAVTVQIQDQYGNLVNSSANVTVAIGNNPSGGTLSGTTAVAASGGTATFSTLKIDFGGAGYTLTASSSGLTGDTSSAFNITGVAITSAASGNWTATGTWTGGVVPVVGDAVTITIGHTVTVNTPTAACASLQLAGGGGVATVNFSGASPALAVSGAVNVGGAANNNRAGIINFTSDATLTAGSVSLNKDTSGSSSTIDMSAGGKMVVGSLAIGGSGSTVVWTPGVGTVELTSGNTLPATFFTSFYNLSINHGGTTTLGVNTAINAGGTLTQQNGNIAVGSLTLTINGTHDAGTGIVSGAGGYTLASGKTLITANASGINGSITTTTKTLNVAANYTFDGTGAQNVGSLLPNNLTGTLTITNTGGTVTLDSAKTIASGGTVSIVSGTFAAGNNLTMASTSTINRSGGSMTGTPQGTGVYNVNYSGNSMTASSELAGSGLNNITVSLTAGQTLTLDQNRAPDGNLNITSGILDLGSFTIDRSASGGTLTVSSGTTLKVGGTGTLPANYSTHSINAASTVEYSGTTQSVATLNSSQNYGDLVISGSGTKTLAGTAGVAGDLTLSGGTLDLGSATLNRTAAGGTLTVSGGTTLKVGGTGTLPSNYSTHSISTGSIVEYSGTTQNVATLNSAQTYGNLVFSGSSTKTVPNGTTVSSNLSISGCQASLVSGINVNVGSLTLGGLGRINGTWGGTGSGATNINTTYFDATSGILTVTTDTRTTPTVSVWPSASSITYGQVLTNSTLTGGAASVAGSFAFTVPGTIPNAGNYSAAVTFTPSDITSYKTVTNNVSVTVNQASTAVAVSSSSQTNGYKDSVSFTATVPAAATGNVTFKTNGFVLSTGTLSSGTATSAATILLPRGTNTVTAEYVGDSNYLGSTNNLAGGQVVTNHPPVAGTDDYTRPYTLSATNSGALKIRIANLLTNDTDAVDGDTVTWAGLNLTSTNGVNLSTNGTFVFYTNSVTLNANDRFFYTISDGNGGTSTGMVVITVVGGQIGQTNATVSVTSSNATITYFGQPGSQYVAQRSTNLTDWVSISTNTAPTNVVFQVIDSYIDLGGTPPGSAYYRLRVP